MLEYAWDLTSTNTSGQAVQLGTYTERTVSVIITNSGGTGKLDIEGSPDETNWYVLKDAADPATPANMSFTGTSGQKKIFETTRYLRPHMSIAGSSADFACYLHLSRPNNLRQ